MERAIWLNKEKNVATEVYLENPNDPAEIKKYVMCDFFDASAYRIGRTLYRIIVDDDGWPREQDDKDSEVSAIASFGTPLMYGNLLIFCQSGNELVGLGDDDIRNIWRRLVVIPRSGLVLVI